MKKININEGNIRSTNKERFTTDGMVKGGNLKGNGGSITTNQRPSSSPPAPTKK